VKKVVSHFPGSDTLIDVCANSLVQKKTTVPISHWKEVLRLAKHHRITRLLESTSANKSSLNHSEEADQLNAINKRNRLRMLAYTAELSLIGRKFEDENIPVIPLKGPVAAYQVYGDFAAKHSRDIDVLIQEENLDQVIELLNKEGYTLAMPYVNYTPKQKSYFQKVSNQLVFFNPRKRIQLEVHWRLFANRYFLPLSFNDLLQTATRVKVGQETTLLAISPEYLMLYLCAHGAKHKWALLYWLHEVATLAKKEEFNWLSLLNNSIHYGIERPVVQGLVLAHELFGIQIDSCILNYYKGRPLIQNLVHSAKEVILMNQSHNASNSILTHWKLLDYKRKLVKSLKYKINFANGISTLDFELIKIPDKLFFAYFWMRPLFWFWRYIISPIKKR